MQHNSSSKTENSEGAHDGLADLQENMQEATKLYYEIVWQILERTQMQSRLGSLSFDVSDLLKLQQDVVSALFKHPDTVMKAQSHFFQQYSALVDSTLKSVLSGEALSPIITPAAKDRRFKDELWHENPYFDFMKQFYLLASNYWMEVMQKVEGLPAKEVRRANFYMRFFLDAMSPSNNVFTNPEVLEEVVRSHGKNLVEGLRNFKADLAKSRHFFSISTTSASAFQLGKDLAATQGKVVFKNRIIELIHYAPTAKNLYQTPILLIPAWINKYYILDLQAHNSLVRYLVENGLDVYVISWKNPEPEDADLRFEDYVLEGALAAIDHIRLQDGNEQVAALGYCLGGTLLSVLLGYLAAQGRENEVVSATFLTTLIDFSDPGDLGLFIDEDQLHHLEEKMEQKGFFEAEEMAAIFSAIRANEMIWNFFVHNYLLGKEPPSFDILYWNSDPTSLPAATHRFYLRHMYLRNHLIKPGRVKIKGVPIDLGKIKTPCYFLSTKEDHIAPWKATFSGAGYIGNGKQHQFVLGASGHVAGIVNPPTSKKYGYWVEGNTKSKTAESAKDPEAWFAAAEAHEGSWWPHWLNWQSKKLGDKVARKVVLDDDLPDAPGSYVRVRSGNPDSAAST